MDRLTFEGNFCDIAVCLEVQGGPHCLDGYCSQRKCWERLKQYEDTGLSPEEIKDINETCESRLLIWFEAHYGFPAGELMRMCEAKKEGRVVFLPSEDAEFLANLRHELLTQPTDGNCDPRFWGVIEEKLEWGYDEECGEGWGVWDSDNYCDVGELDDLQSVIDELTDPHGYEYEQEEFADCDDIEEVLDRANDLGGRFSLNYYRRHHVVSEDHLFLTKKACREYIDRYGYNHKNPHTYVMTADRCPEYERLLKILKETEWKGGAE